MVMIVRNLPRRNRIRFRIDRVRFRIDRVRFLPGVPGSFPHVLHLLQDVEDDQALAGPAGPLGVSEGCLQDDHLLVVVECPIHLVAPELLGLLPLAVLVDPLLLFLGPGW